MAGGGGTGGVANPCGDGALTEPEACDDGNAEKGDGCDDLCMIEAGFACTGQPSVCTPVCGDGMVKGAETCDDGGTLPGDGCDAACALEMGWVCNGEPSLCCFPEAEVCDGKDNDCNGVPDEGCNCVDGMTMNCYTGGAGTEGVGLCTGGVQTCVNGNWGACVGEVIPSMEICDGLDQDCDGAPDDNAGCICIPNTTKSCYTGPMNTENVGICKAGTSVCAPDGKSYGACVGQILPAPENCATPLDDDCNGFSPACTGAHIASKGFGDAQIQQGYSIATDPMGNVFVTGAYTGTIDFGAGALTSAGGNDIFVAKFDPAGTLLWAKSYGATGDQFGYGIATDSAGNAFVTGGFANNVSFGPFALTNAGGDDFYVLKLAPNGTEMFAYNFGGTATQVTYGIAVDAQDNVLVTGAFSANFMFGMTQLVGQGNLDAFVAKMSNTGTPMWAKAFGAALNQQALEVAADPFGNVLLTGAFQTSIDFGGGMITCAGGEDLFIAKLDAMGNHVWSKGYGDATDQRGLGIAADPGGNVLVTGWFQGTTDFGAGNVTSGGTDDGFVLKLDAAGSHVWSKTFGAVSAQRGKGIRSDALGNVLVTGEFFGQINFGGASVTSTGLFDIFVAKLSGSGSQVWLKRFGNTQNDRGEAVAVDPSGNAWFTGSYINNVDFGGGSVTGNAAENVFLLGLQP
jgi:cysteine-rich repeat protein